MEISEQLRCLFSGRVEERDESYVIEVPEREIRLDEIEEGGIYQIALLSTPTESAEESDQKQDRTRERGRERDRKSEREHDSLKPPVDEGETRTVEIESVGDQGDGITRVERGFVVIVPDTDKGERVRIEISQVRDTVAFADVVERIDYYE
ncbi:TRAM domain-containing protein [Natronorubrum halophilum]|uniref:TRAM domain-containing protein n=1 Tax=Natronorubrum halophilum TaxID=1702106 RepID=UPI000EF6F0E7|nr:TRAM domain-containing protein [Natronorubrum halophilum]